MQDTAFHFKKQSKRLRQALWMKNAKLLALLTCLIVVFLCIIIAACCGGITLPSCRSLLIHFFVYITKTVETISIIL
ncbi:PREDICTED: vesicle-associated membrane protein 714-like [Fragaria vesca subsp. vesca]